MIRVSDLIRLCIDKNKLLDGCTGVVLAVSGGSDSMTLLHWFIDEKLHVPFSVAHINHSLRPEADDEEEFVRDYCKKNNVPYDSVKVDIHAEKPVGQSVEEYARAVRYRFFYDMRKKRGYSHIATAHNKNDATESFFLNIVRGAGANGASGLPVIRADNVIRPLLYCEKNDINAYCAENNIPYVTDKTNFISVCSRNILRNEVLPRLRALNPRLDDAVTRYTETVNDDEIFFSRLVEDALKSFGENRQKNEIPLNFLKSAEKPVVSRLLRRVFSELTGGVVLTFAQTNDIILLITIGKTSDRVWLPGNIYATLGYSSLYFAPETVSDSIDESVLLAEGENIIGGFTITVEKNIVTTDNYKRSFLAEFPLYIRSRRAGDKIKLKNRPDKLIKELFIDEKIPSNERSDRLLVTSENGEILWLSGFGANDGHYPEINGEAITVNIKKQTGTIKMREIKEYISEETIKSKVAELGKQIAKDYEGSDKNLILVSILKGSVVFMSDLIRNIDTDLSIDFMIVSSYGKATSSRGNVKIIKDLDINIQNYDLLIVEDILDSGYTLSKIIEMLKTRKPKSLKICALLDKPDRRVADVKLDYCGFVIPDEFIVGYGLDYDEKYRNLPYIGIYEP